MQKRKGGRILFNNGTLDNANINRSPRFGGRERRERMSVKVNLCFRFSYLFYTHTQPHTHPTPHSAYTYNPSAERALYPNNTDHNMTLLRFEDENGSPLGLVNWFAVHGMWRGSGCQWYGGRGKERDRRIGRGRYDVG